MLRRLAAGSSALALLLLLVAPPGPRVALAAGGTCTGWTSEYVPPPTIRVLRTVGPAKGTVQVVPFRRYVTTVLAAEFGPSSPIEALRAGAVAVKDYGWYYAMHWRGKSAPNGGGCYDVQDNTWDQVYWPEHDRASDRQVQAVLDTWRVSVRKDGRFLPTGYRPGTPGTACGSDADGWRLYQASAYRCALQGMLYPEILRTYYRPHFQIVVPGVHDANGDGLGSIGIALPGTGQLVGSAVPVPTASPAPSAPALPASSASPDASAPTSPSVSASSDPGASPSPTPSGSLAASDPATTAPAGFFDLVWADAPQQAWQPSSLPPGTSLDPVTTLDWAFADVNHDGRSDVLRLERLGTAGYRVTVSLSLGDGQFAPAATWWSSVGTGLDLAPTDAVQLLAGDFDGDGIGDAAILAGAPGTPPVAAGTNGTAAVPAVTPQARLYLLRSTGTGFAPPQTWWSGPLDVSGARAFAADVTGDGRADLVVESDLYPSDLPVPPAAPPSTGPGGAELPVGMRFLVAPSGSGTGLGRLTGWFDVTDTTRAQAQTVVEDVNSDGRADVVFLRPVDDAGSQIVGLLSTGRGFVRSALWSSASFRASASKIAAADLNGDGRGDLVVLYDVGSGGTRLYQFLSTGTAFRAGARVLDPALDWANVTPF